MDVALTSTQWWVLAIFVTGYLAIIFEHSVGVNKTTSALLTAVGCWIAQFAGPLDHAQDMRDFTVGFAEASQIVFFLLGALVIVEIVQAHGGLNLVGRLIRCSSKKAMLWVVGLVAFFLSSILDNLTTTVVMLMLVRRLIEGREERWIFGSLIVIAANAGGAWTPIGDVTTTMLWIGGKLSSASMMKTLFSPSFGCLVAATAACTGMVRGSMQEKHKGGNELAPWGRLVLCVGLGSLMAVPVMRYYTGLPPFMGMLFSMAVLWLLTDFLHGRHESRQHLRLAHVLPRIDTMSLLFFLGILLSVNVLGISGVLQFFAESLDAIISSKEVLAVIIGLISSVVDNVPLVAACMGMYDMTLFPMDSAFWTLIAFTAGTGGSLLIIGSAAGVAFMGLEKVDFFWYMRKASLPALCGYVVGILFFLLQQAL